MRQIEKEMNHAIRVQKKYFSKGNTAVRTSADGIESQIYLHHNLIGSYNHPKRELTIFDGGWQSNTTKSRLNALLNEFAYGFFPAMANAQVERFTHQFIIYEDHVLPERFHGKLLGVDVLHNNVVMSE